MFLCARGPIAQLAEHRADNAGVTGAIPVRPTNFHPRWRVKIGPEHGRNREGRAKGQDPRRDGGEKMILSEAEIGEAERRTTALFDL